jgi:hypothetical protein
MDRKDDHRPGGSGTRDSVASPGDVPGGVGCKPQPSALGFSMHGSTGGSGVQPSASGFSKHGSTGGLVRVSIQD